MRKVVHRLIRPLALLIAFLLLVLLGTYQADGIVLAHGKELTIEVSSFAPDPQEPLTRLYRVYVTYAGDRDPVDGAEVRLNAERIDGGPVMESVMLEPLNEEGLYAAQITFPLYGTWNVTLGVDDVQGEGEAVFIEEVIPPSPTADIEDVRRQVLEIFFRFNWWDVAAIVVRVSHTLAGIAWFSMTGLVLAAYLFLSSTGRSALFHRLSPVFLPVAGLSLTLLAASGVYTAIYSAPIKPPGVLDIDTMLRIPFGPAYVATIAFKVIALSALGVLAASMARALRRAAVPIVAGGAIVQATGVQASRIDTRMSAKGDALFRMAVANAAIGLFLAIDIVLAVYIHYISHLAVFLPE